MKKQKRTKAKWQLVCDNCYRRQYCQFILNVDCCVLFRPKDKDLVLTRVNNEYIITNQ